MIQISSWTDSFIQALDARFGSRVWFVGLQGSYSRGEATENSDIDMVVILDELTAADLKTYSDMLDTLEHRELICGFLAGKAQLLHWEPSDLFQFYYDTTPLKGSLTSCCRCLTPPQSAKPSKPAYATFITAACTTCSTKRAKTF